MPKYIKKAEPGMPGPDPAAGPMGAPMGDPMAGPPGAPPGPGGMPPGPEMPSADPNAEPTLLPRMPGEDPIGGPVPPGPGLGMPGLMGGPPTDVHIDAETGEVTIKKGPVNISVAEKTSGHDIPTAKKPWREFNHGTPPDVNEGEPGREDYFKDTWETPYAAPANRRTPPTYDVVARVPAGGNARGLAYAVQLYTTLRTEVDGQTVTISGSENPVALINELKAAGIDASTTGLLEDYPKAGEAAREYMGYEPGIYSPGVKVAIVGDFPDMAYQYDPDFPAVEAQVIARRGDEYLVRNDIWGTFVVEPHEIVRADGL